MSPPIRTPAQIEEALRLMLNGVSRAEIAAQLGMRSETVFTGLWYHFKNKYLLNERLATTQERLAKLEQDGYTLTEVEVNQLAALQRSGTGKKGPQMNAPRSTTALRSSEELIKETIKSDWLLREGIPYAKAGERDCTTPMVKVPGNVCGVEIEAGRRHKGKTTCQKCADASLRPADEQRTSAATRARPSFKHYHPPSR
jgi:hypothetical protein